MAISATVTFVRGGDTATVRSPLPEYTLRHERRQSIIRTATGAVTVYDKAVEVYTLVLEIECTEAQRNDLDDFFKDTAKGGLETFTYTDHTGDAHALSRFMQTELVWRKTRSGYWRVRLELEVAARAD